MIKPELYAKVNGQEAADKKRESDKDGLSINALDGLLDKVSAEDQKALTEPQKPEEPVSVSPELATARARVQQYEEDVLSGNTVFGKGAAEQQAEAESFADRYKKRMGVQNEEGNYVAADDQARYDRDMETYNKARADFEAQKAQRLGTN